MEFTFYEILYFDHVLNRLRFYLLGGDKYDKYIGLVAIAYKVKVRIEINDSLI